MRTATRRTTVRFASAALATLLLLTVLVAPVAAFAATSDQFTTAEVSSAPKQGDAATTYGGHPARFTFTLVASSKAASMTAFEIDFPKGTDLSKTTADVVVLVGLARRPVTARTTISGEKLGLALDKEIGALSNTRIRVYDVVTPKEDGTLVVNGSWTGPAASGTLPDMAYVQKSPTVWVDVESWLDGQTWVKAWNSVPLLAMFLKPQLMVRSIPWLFIGWLLSIALVAVSFPMAIPVGLGLAFMKMSRLGIVRWIAGAYINVIRGTPLFLQMFIAFFALPLAGVQADPFLLGVIVLALNSLAYLAEIFRAGIQSISKGQFEAASSLGMTYPQAMAFVIIPQTVRRVLPTMTSEFILLFKDTALLAAVGVFELMKFAQTIAANTGNVTPYVEAAAFYLILTIPLINWVGSLEHRLALSEGGTGTVAKKKKIDAATANRTAAEAAGNIPGAS